MRSAWGLEFYSDILRFRDEHFLHGDAVYDGHLRRYHD